MLLMLIALPLPARAQRTAAEALRPLQFLAGACWKGTFPNGTVTDEHCFERVFDGQFLRDQHVVRGAPTPYEGETMYAWDAENQRIVYWYAASDGNFSTGHVRVGDDGVLIFPETHVSAAGTREMENVWRRTGPDEYFIEVFDITGGNRRLLWSMTMTRSSPHRP